MCEIVRDPLLCLSTLLLPPTTFYLISEEIDEEPVTPMQALCGGYCCFYGFLIRTRLREKYNLQGSIELDMISHCLCHCFALSHDYCEVKAWKAAVWEISSPEKIQKPTEPPPSAECFWSEEGHRLEPRHSTTRNGLQQKQPQDSHGGDVAQETSLLERLDKLKSREELESQRIIAQVQLDSQEQVSNQDKIDSILTDDELIDEMRYRLSQDFDPSRPTMDVVVPENIFVDYPLPGDDAYSEGQDGQWRSIEASTPAYVPSGERLPQQPQRLQSTQNDRTSSVASAGYVELSSAGGSLRVGVGRGGFFHVQQAHEVTSSGAREWGQFSVRPPEFAPEYTGSGHYPSAGASRQPSSARSHR